MMKTENGVGSAGSASKVHDAAEVLHQQALIKTGALQYAILNSVNFSIIATDEKGIIQLFNAGAERMLGYTASEVVTGSVRAISTIPRK
jgi:PAS domain-containing protein